MARTSAGRLLITIKWVTSTPKTLHVVYQIRIKSNKHTVRREFIVYTRPEIYEYIYI